MAIIPLRIKSRTLTLAPLRPFSSRAPPFQNPNPNPNPDGDDNSADAASSPPPPPRASPSSMFSDIKERLRTPQQSPRRIVSDAPPPPDPSPQPSAAASLDEIRKHLAEFRLRSGPNSNPSPGAGSGSGEGRPASFQELFRRNVGSAQDPDSKPENRGLSYESIRESLRNIKPSAQPQRFQSLFGRKDDASGPSLMGKQESLPGSIFGREMREKEGGGEVKELKTELMKMYRHDELGEKLKQLRPEAVEKGKKDWFSLDELNLRLAKLRELEEKESESRTGGASVTFSDLRRSLMKLKDSENAKKANTNKLSILSAINVSSKPSFMLKPPQEHLLENVCSEMGFF